MHNNISPSLFSTLHEYIANCASTAHKNNILLEIMLNVLVLSIRLGRWCVFQHIDIRIYIKYDYRLISKQESIPVGGQLPACQSYVFYVEQVLTCGGHCTLRSKWNNFQHVGIPVQWGPSLTSSNMSVVDCTVRSKLNKFQHVWRPCTVRSKLNKFQLVLGVLVQWNPSWISFNMSGSYTDNKFEHVGVIVQWGPGWASLNISRGGLYSEVQIEQVSTFWVIVQWGPSWTTFKHVLVVHIQWGPGWTSFNMWGTCTVRSKLNKFEHILGEPYSEVQVEQLWTNLGRAVQSGPSWTTLNISGGGLYSEVQVEQVWTNLGWAVQSGPSWTSFNMWMVRVQWKLTENITFQQISLLVVIKQLYNHEWYSNSKCFLFTSLPPFFHSSQKVFCQRDWNKFWKSGQSSGSNVMF